jgi:hypothetical protein
MVDQSELRRVPVFADLPDEQLDWFISQSQAPAKLTFSIWRPATSLECCLFPG